MMSGQIGRVTVIGLSGTTNSGKTTLARKLVQALPNCLTVCQDAYYLVSGDPRLEQLYLPEVKHHNWEDYRALEMDRMVNEVKQLMSTAEQNRGGNHMFIVVEGFSIFGWRRKLQKSPLASLFDMKYFLNVDREVCFDRRKLRNYDPPDVPGYFEKIVWPMHLKHLNMIKDQEDIVYLDGNDMGAMDKNVSRMLLDIEKVKNSTKTIISRV